MNRRAGLVAGALSLAGSAATAGPITGLDPLSLGANERAAADRGISSVDSLTLQRVASQEIAIAAVPEPEGWALMAGGLMLVGGWARRRRGGPRTA